MLFPKPVSSTLNSHNKLVDSLLQMLTVISQIHWTATNQASKRINRFKAYCFVIANNSMIVYTRIHTILNINKGIFANFFHLHPHQKVIISII